MRDTTRLDWRVPSGPYENLIEHVENEYGEKAGYLGREVEVAMKEHIDLDGYNDLEEKLNELIQAAGRTVGELREEKNISRTFSEDRMRATARVETTVKEQFKKHCNKHDKPYGHELARAIDAYLDGGRRERMERKLDRVLEDATAILAELNDDTDDGLDAVQRRTIRIASLLGPSFTDDELESAIREVGITSDPSIKKYRRLVIEHRDVKPHPNRPSIYIDADEADDWIEDGVPEVVAYPPSFLDREDKLRRVRIAVGAEAYANSRNKACISASNIRDRVFDNELSIGSVKGLMQELANEHYYRVHRSESGVMLAVNQANMGRERKELAEAIVEYHESDRECLLDGAGNWRMEQFITMPGEGEKNSTAAIADGGEPSGGN